MAAKAPEVLIKVGGKNIENAWKADIGTVQVVLVMEGESRATVAIQNAYDYPSHSVKKEIDSGALPGEKVEIMMGYAGDKKTVFKGYLDGVRLMSDKEQGYTLLLIAYDAIRLMKDSFHCRIWSRKRFSDVYSEILKAYHFTGLKESCDATASYEKERFWYQNESDYAFVMEELIRKCPEAREFYITAGTACYKKPGTSRTVMTVDDDTEIRKKAVTVRFLNHTLRVSGSSAAGVTYTGSSTAKGKILSGAAGAIERSEVIPEADSQDMADGIAAAWAARRKQKTKELELTMDGNYELLVGNDIAVAGLGKTWNGTYQIRRAVHCCDKEGYRTTIKAEGYK